MGDLRSNMKDPRKHKTGSVNRQCSATALLAGAVLVFAALIILQFADRLNSSENLFQSVRGEDLGGLRSSTPSEPTSTIEKRPKQLLPFVYHTCPVNCASWSKFKRFFNARFTENDELYVYLDEGSYQEKMVQSSYFGILMNILSHIAGQTLPSDAPKSISRYHWSPNISEERSVRVEVKYKNMNDGSDNCKVWVEKPAYLVNIKFDNRNQFLFFNLGLIAAFQTMRELGYLPIREVSSADNGLLQR